MKFLSKARQVIVLGLCLALSGCFEVTQKQADEMHAKAAENRTKAAKAREEGKNDLADALIYAATQEELVEAGEDTEPWEFRIETLWRQAQEAQAIVDELEAKYGADANKEKVVTNTQPTQNKVAPAPEAPAPVAPDIVTTDTLAAGAVTTAEAQAVQNSSTPPASGTDIQTNIGLTGANNAAAQETAQQAAAAIIAANNPAGAGGAAIINGQIAVIPQASQAGLAVP